MCWDAWSRIGFTVLCLAVLASTLGGPPWLLVRAKGDRGLLIGTWLVAMLFGALYIIAAYTIIDANAELVYLAALAAGAGAGLAVGVLAGRRRPSLTTLGLLGIGTPAAVPLALFVGPLAAFGVCLE
jgi:hypothetical protein